MLADKPDVEDVLLLIGGVLAKLTTSMPAVTLVVPEFCRLVTAAIARFGSTAMAVGGPLSAMVGTNGADCTCPVPFDGLVGSKVVRSMAESVLDPLFATRARARSRSTVTPSGES